MDNNLFYETDIKIRFDNSNHKNEFLGVAGDSETRKLNFSVFDSEGAPVLTNFPELKLLVKGEYDGIVYYSIAEKKQGNQYSVVVPSQIFKQKQTVKMQFVIEDKAKKKKIYTSIIKQKVAEGLCSNAVEGTNIYIDYDEIKELETRFSIFLKQVEETKNEIDEEFKGFESKINNLEGLMHEELEKLMLEEVQKAVENIKADVQVDLNAERDKVMLEISVVGDNYKSELEALKTGSLEEIKKQSEAELKVIKDTRNISVTALDSKKVTCIQEIEAAGVEEITKVSGSGDEAVIKIETATNEAIKTIDNKIAGLDTERIMQKLSGLEALITGFDDRIKANADTIAGHSEAIKSINDNVLVHQTDIDTVADDLNKKI